MRGRGRWRRRLGRTSISEKLRSWLLEPGSLTARCQRASREFRVRLVFGGRGASLLDPKARLPVYAREVVLECDGVAVIFAHTEVSLVPRGRAMRWLQRLGNRSLGSLLFASPLFRREAIFVCRLKPDDALFRRAASVLPLDGVRCLWARQSAHHLGEQTIVVTEIFLPTIASLNA